MEDKKREVPIELYALMGAVGHVLGLDNGKRIEDIPLNILLDAAGVIYGGYEFFIERNNKKQNKKKKHGKK